MEAGRGYHAKAPVGLLDFHNELLAAVCQNLCLHCQTARVFDQPKAVIAQGQGGQLDLANLSRTCHILRNVAQPVLFHYYHHGGAKQRRLISFITAVLDRPALGSFVKSCAIDVETTNFASVRSFPQFQELREELARILWHIRHRDEIKRLEPFLGTGTDWLATFTTLLLPNLQECLTVADPNYVDYLGRHPFNPDIALRHVTYLALKPLHFGSSVPDFPDYHIYYKQAFLACMPNLETLIAPDCGGECTHEHRYMLFPEPSPQDWNLKLERLRVLSVSGLDPRCLKAMLPYFPRLEDLEYYSRLAPDNWPLPLCSEDLKPIAGTLRRLCYSIAPQEKQFRPSPSQQGHQNTPAVYEDLFPYTSHERAPEDLRGFAALEVLELEQDWLYPQVLVDEEGDILVEEDDHPYSSESASLENQLKCLPASLRVLHVGDVIAWPVLRHDLLALAAESVKRYPDLRVVHVDRVVRQAEQVYLEDDILLKTVLGAAGIKFVVGNIPLGNAPRGMLGPRPGRPEYIDRGGTLYGLDGHRREW